MAVRLDHLIVLAHDKHQSATFLADMLGLPPPVEMGKFLAVAVGGVSFDFADAPGEFRPQHYAFGVGDDEFDAVLARVRACALPFWADPQRTRRDEIGRRGDGRAIYFADPSGHWLEVLT